MAKIPLWPGLVSGTTTFRMGNRSFPPTRQSIAQMCPPDSPLAVRGAVFVYTLYPAVLRRRRRACSEDAFPANRPRAHSEKRLLVEVRKT